MLTKQFKEVYPVQQLKATRILKKMVDEIAAEEVLKKYPKSSDAFRKKKLPEFMEYAEYEAMRRVYDMQNFHDVKSINKHLLPRTANFPEFWDSAKAKKRIQVYETDYSVIERMWASI